MTIYVLSFENCDADRYFTDREKAKAALWSHYEFYYKDNDPNDWRRIAYEQCWEDGFIDDVGCINATDLEE